MLELRCLNKCTNGKAIPAYSKMIAIGVTTTSNFNRDTGCYDDYINIVAQCETCSRILIHTQKAH